MGKCRYLLAESYDFINNHATGGRAVLYGPQYTGCIPRSTTSSITLNGGF